MPHPAAIGGSRFLALGDSYTIGEGLAPAQAWPAQLARRLRAAGIALDDPSTLAQTGWTTDELAAAMDAHAFAPPYALVSLLIGVNNQYRGRDLADYAMQFAALLERAVTLAGARSGHVIVVSIPDWGVTRFAGEQARDPAQVAARIDAFNARAQAIAHARGVAFVDITAASREAGPASHLLVADGLHPSAAQYACWVDAILPVARHALTSR